MKRFTGRRFSAALLCIALCFSAESRPVRSHQARAEFQAANPCPSTGKTRGSCPGWIVDHVEPICAGGADRPENMAWQTVADAKVKDRAERAQCRR